MGTGLYWDETPTNLDGGPGALLDLEMSEGVVFEIVRGCRLSRSPLGFAAQMLVP